MRFNFDDGTRLYCRGCQRVTPHEEVNGRAACAADGCKRYVEPAELVAIYATDTDSRPHEFLFPEQLLSPLAYVRRLNPALLAFDASGVSGVEEGETVA